MVHAGGFVCNAKEDFEHAEMDKQCFGMPFLTVATWGTVVTYVQLLTIQASETDQLLREVSLLAIGKIFYHSNITNGLLRANS